jgi:hypothetical protein
MDDVLIPFADVGGVAFEVVETNCDTLAKDDWISVYVWRNDKGRPLPLVPKAPKQKTLIFEYDGWPNLPSISVDDENRVLVSVSSLSEVGCESPSWGDVSFRYAIGHEYYPHDGPIPKCK